MTYITSRLFFSFALEIPSKHMSDLLGYYVLGTSDLVGSYVGIT
jgi:hypothetical protein